MDEMDDDLLGGHWQHDDASGYIHAIAPAQDLHFARPIDDSFVKLQSTNSEPHIDTLDDKSILNLLFSQDKEGDNYLHLYIIHQRKDDVLRIIAQVQGNGAILDLQNDDGYTALHLATITQQPDIVHALLLNGASHLVQDSVGRMPLHIACEMGDLLIVEILTGLYDQWENILQYGNIVNYKGETCLYTAARHGHVDIVQYLAQLSKQDINFREHKAGKTVLHLAVEKRDARLLDILLNNEQIDITVENYSGHRALVLARYHPNSWNCIIENKPELEDILTHEFYEDLSSDQELLPEA